jgi:hypothetical protein
MNKLIFAFLFCFVLCSESFSGTIDPNTPDSKYIEYGTKFNYVGRVLIKKNNDEEQYSGSCVAHKDKVIITAAHLFNEYKTALLFINNKLIPIDKIVIYQDYEYNKFAQHDIAICFLKNDIGLEWYPELYADIDETGKLCSLSGFGSTGTFLNGVSKAGGTKRAGSNHIDIVDPHMIFCSPSEKNNRTSLEFLIAPGDSGGGLFIGNKLAGIHSFVIENKINKGKSKYGAISAHTRISTYKNWIEKTILEFQEKE